MDAKDQVTHGHIRRVQRHTVALARVLGVNDEIELKALEAASLLHDVGKLAVPDYVLNKPGALSHAEFERIKLHAAKGAEILTAVEFPYPVVPIVRSHHEQWNGQGYPDGLSGEDIPFGARILTVVDCFDAVTSDRPYRRQDDRHRGHRNSAIAKRVDVRPANCRDVHRPRAGPAARTTGSPMRTGRRHARRSRRARAAGVDSVEPDAGRGRGDGPRRRCISLIAPMLTEKLALMRSGRHRPACLRRRPAPTS